MEDKPEAEPANPTVVINIEEEKNNPFELVHEKEADNSQKKVNDNRVIKLKDIIQIRRNNERPVYVSGDPNTYGYGQQPYYSQQQGYYPQQQAYYPQQQIAGQTVYVQVSVETAHKFYEK